MTAFQTTKLYEFIIMTNFFPYTKNKQNQKQHKNGRQRKQHKIDAANVLLFR